MKHKLVSQARYIVGKEMAQEQRPYLAHEEKLNMISIDNVKTWASFTTDLFREVEARDN